MANAQHLELRSGGWRAPTNPMITAPNATSTVPTRRLSDAARSSHDVRRQDVAGSVAVFGCRRRAGDDRPVGDGPQGQRPQVGGHVAKGPAHRAGQARVVDLALGVPATDEIEQDVAVNTPTEATVQPIHQIVRRRFADRATTPIAAPN